MNGRFPTFKRLFAAAAQGWTHFSYKESIAARGAAYTLVCWSLLAGLLFLVLLLPELAGQSGEGNAAENADLVMLVLMAVVAGSPLAGFIAGAALSGGAKGFLDSLKQGGKAAAFPALALLVLAAASLGSSSEKAGLAAALIFWIGALAALTGVIGGMLRWTAGLLFRQSR